MSQQPQTAQASPPPTEFVDAAEPARDARHRADRRRRAPRPCARPVLRLGGAERQHPELHDRRDARCCSGSRCGRRCSSIDRRLAAVGASRASSRSAGRRPGTSGSVITRAIYGIIGNKPVVAFTGWLIGAVFLALNWLASSFLGADLLAGMGLSDPVVGADRRDARRLGAHGARRGLRPRADPARVLVAWPRAGRHLPDRGGVHPAAASTGSYRRPSR